MGHGPLRCRCPRAVSRGCSNKFGVWHHARTGQHHTHTCSGCCWAKPAGRKATEQCEGGRREAAAKRTSAPVSTANHKMSQCQSCATHAVASIHEPDEASYAEPRSSLGRVRPAAQACHVVHVASRLHLVDTPGATTSVRNADRARWRLNGVSAGEIHLLGGRRYARWICKIAPPRRTHV